MTGSPTVLVTGPPRAGVTGVAAALRRRMPSCRVVEADDTDPAGPPAAVVFVVSAVAPVTESDCALVDFAAGAGGVTIAAVTKVDDHRDWRGTLERDRELSRRYGSGLAAVPWVGVAAAPRLGTPRIDDLVTLLEGQLGDPALRGRVRDARLRRLQEERTELMRHRRVAAREEVAAARAEVAQARLALARSVRQRSAALRRELADEAATARHNDLVGFGERARTRCADLVDGIDDDIAAHLPDTPNPARAVVTMPDPPSGSRRLEGRLIAVLGAGFGLGVAVVVTRLASGLAPGSAAGWAVGAVAGLVTAVWMIRARALLAERAVLAAWTGEVAAAVRVAAEERVAASLLAAEIASTRARDGGRDDDIGRRIAALEAEIGRLAASADASSEPGAVLPISRPPGYGDLNRSCE